MEKMERFISANSSPASGFRLRFAKISFLNFVTVIPGATVIDRFRQRC